MTDETEEPTPDDLESAEASQDARKPDRKVNHWFTVEVAVSIDIAQILFAVIGVPVVGAVLLAWVTS